MTYETSTGQSECGPILRQQGEVMKTITKKLVLAYLLGVLTASFAGEVYWQYFKLTAKVDYMFGYIQTLDAAMRSGR